MFEPLHEQESESLLSCDIETQKSRVLFAIYMDHQRLPSITKYAASVEPMICKNTGLSPSLVRTVLTKLEQDGLVKEETGFSTRWVINEDTRLNLHKHFLESDKESLLTKEGKIVFDLIVSGFHTTGVMAKYSNLTPEEIIAGINYLLRYGFIRFLHDNFADNPEDDTIFIRAGRL